MSVTVVENIALVLESRLQTLLTPGTENTTASEVVRPCRLDGYSPKDLQIVLTQGDTDINEELSYPGNPPATCFETQFNIRCHSLPSEDDTNPKASLINEFAADVRKVLCTPQNTWQTFGGYAVDARFGATENINSESFDGVNLPLVVTYRTDENDPYTARA